MNKKKIIWQIPFLLILVIGTVIILKQGQENINYQHDEGFIFGTVYHITYHSDTNLKKEIEAELKKVDESLSPFNKTSIISKVNRNENPVVNSMFTEVFLLAEDISNETHGAFDITVAPLVNEWGFGFKKGVEPNKKVIDDLRKIVGYQKVKLTSDNHIQKQDPRIMLDCSAIAKGYGCDVVARLLSKKGINDYMIEIGGEIVTKGINQKQQPWRIGVNKPTEDSLNTNQELQTVLNVTDIAMATSGNYRNFYYKNGKKYAHTIDPKTGYPVQHSLLSATVLAKNCATADAYATSFMVMGLEKAKEILRQHSELMAYLIYTNDDGKTEVWYSPSLKEKILGDS